MTLAHAAALIGLTAFPPGWAVHPVYRRGELAGFFCTLGAEIHCHRLTAFTGRWLTRQDLERLTKPIFAEHGHLLTMVRRGNATGHAFVQRLGFCATHQDDDKIYYKAERLNHARL